MMNAASGDKPLPSLFFIAGRGRSGTTLLSRVLSAHPDLTVAPEGFFALNLYNKYKSGPWNHEQIDRFCHDLLLENRMKTWDLPFEKIRQAMIKQRDTLTYAKACQLVYGIYAAQNGKNIQWAGDKNPHYALFINKLLSIFPDAKVIYLVRDYRDNIRSYKQVPFDLQGTSELAYRWKIYNRSLINAQARHQQQFYFLRFEDLLTEPGHYLSDICRFLDVQYNPEMLNFYLQNDTGFYGKESPWFDKLKSPLDPSMSQKWRDMPEYEIKMADNICGSMGKAWGYHPESKSYKGLSKFRKIKGWLIAWLSVGAEKTLFYYLPLKMKTRIINKYRSGSGRI